MKNTKRNLKMKRNLTFAHKLENKKRQVKTTYDVKILNLEKLLNFLFENISK